MVDTEKRLTVFLVCFLFVAMFSSLHFSKVSAIDAYTYPKGLFFYGVDGALDSAQLRHCTAFDYVITEFGVTNIAALHALKPNIKVLGYRSGVFVTNRSVEWSIVTTHEDWFVHARDDGARLIDGYYGAYLMNISNPEWRSYIINETQNSVNTHDFDGIFIDNAWEKLNKDWFTWNWTLSKIPNLPNWKTDYETFFMDLNKTISPHIIIANEMVWDYLPYVGGELAENFPYWHSIDKIMIYSSQGKTIWVAAGWGNVGDTYQNFTFSLSSYLLGVNSSETVYSWATYYDSVHGYYPEMDQIRQLGDPTGTAFYYNGTFRRTFGNGTVLVNNSTSSIIVTLEKPLQFHNGTSILTFMLPSESGIILYDIATPATTPTPSAPSPAISPSPSPNYEAMPTFITISIDALSPDFGSLININGRLYNSRGIGAARESIALSYSFEEASSFFPISSNITNEAGYYNIQWNDPPQGILTLKAEYAGSATHLGTANTVTISFLQVENQNVFFVESNSTVSALAFNGTALQLSFTVSGTSGNEGYVKAAIAKRLMANSEDIKVYLDGNQLSHSIISRINTWLVSFNYYHSTHQISINLTSNEGLPTSSGGANYLFYIVAISAMIVASILSGFVLRNRKHTQNARS